MTLAKAPWRNRIVGSGEEAPDQLVANPGNWRRHPGRQRDALRGSLGEVGWVQQVLVNRTTGNVVDGHARIEEALSKGEPTVPVLYVELTPEEESLVLATLDPIAAMAEVDQAQLAELLGAVSTDDPGLLSLLADLGALTGRKAGLVDPDEAVPLRPDPEVEAGELWQLGDHRVYCGDATRPADVAALLDTPIDLVWTDPPYGIAYQADLTRAEAKVLRRRKDGLEVSGDDVGPEELRRLLRESLRLAGLPPGAPYYLTAPGGATLRIFLEVLDELGMALRQQIVWSKQRIVMGRADYQGKHENVLYGWREGAAHPWYGGRTLTTVWEVDRPWISPEHPTMKPVELVARGLEASSRPGETVYDPFLGSGTTLIACEQLGRRGLGMEIDPAYVRVAIDRWVQFTGREAVQLGTGRTIRNVTPPDPPAIPASVGSAT